MIVEFHRAVDDPWFPALREVTVDLKDSRIDYVCDGCGRHWSEYWSSVGFGDRFEIVRALEPRDGGRFRTRVRAWVDRRREDRRAEGRGGGRRREDQAPVEAPHATTSGPV